MCLYLGNLLWRCCLKVIGCVGGGVVLGDGDMIVMMVFDMTVAGVMFWGMNSVSVSYIE